MRKKFKLFNDNSKLKTICFRIIVKQLSFFLQKISQIDKTIFTVSIFPCNNSLDKENSLQCRLAIAERLV